MSFSLDASGLRRVQDYAKAVEIEAEIVPIRGKSPECKPLDKKRNKQSVTIRRVGEDVVVKAYYTDLLTYKPDGEIVVDTNGYASVSTADILTQVLGVRVLPYGGRLWIQLAGWYVLGRGTRLRLFYDRGFGGEVLNPIHVQVRQLNRKKTKVVRDKFRPFMDYARGMCKLLAVDGSITVESARGDYQQDQDLWYLITCEAEADKLEDFAEALRSLMSVTCKQEWVYNGTNGVSQPYITTRRTTFAAMQRYMMKMAYKMHASDVLDTNTAPLGQLAKDKYDAW
jgi:hypothetical protein